MTKKEKFEVAVAAFEVLLSIRGLWHAYLSCFHKNQKQSSNETIYTDWKAWAKNTKMHEWVACAFVWEETQQGHHIWKDFEYMWLIYICDNLNN